MARKLTICSIIICAFLILNCLAVEKPAASEGVSLTIYNNDFGVVRDSRKMDFKEGINKNRFTDVAAEIDPTSVSFQCLSKTGVVSVLEQNYEYDLVNSESLLKRYIDKKVNVKLKEDKETSGTLLNAASGSLIIKTDEDIEIIGDKSIERISLKEMPEDLVTKPTLVWLTEAKEAGEQLCQVTYTTGRIGWKADYSAVLNQAEDRLDFSGWVTIDNKSGGTYADAAIKLIAGDVRRVVEQRPIPQEERMTLMMAKGAARGFEEKPFMEYHLYTLGRKSTINNNQVKQIEFITPAPNVPVKKLYIYERSTRADKIQIKLEFENSASFGLGIALPKGKIRVFKKDPADGTLEFVGEDLIDHTARKEKLSIYIGDAFDIVPEYKMLESKQGRRSSTQTHQIQLRNRKDTPAEVFVDEKFPQWVNWKIDQATHKYEKRDAQTVRFTVKLPADSEATVQYTVTQTW